MQIALVHDWLLFRGGDQRTLEAIHELYPVPIYTLLKDEKQFAHTRLAQSEIHTSFLQKFPFSKRLYRHYLPLFPLAIESFCMENYDVVISSSHAVAKGVKTKPHQMHICYCYTPMRYAWDLYRDYLQELGFCQRQIAKIALRYLRRWDLAATGRVDHFIASSHYIARRIRRCYNRESRVIYPPVEIDDFRREVQKEDFYITVSRLVPYKKVGLIVEAFVHKPHLRLIVVGEGPEWKRIKAKATKNVEMIGALPDSEVRTLMAQAKAFIFAAEEDFGIAPVEAQGLGTPVIALGKGGALETVVLDKTGLFFKEPTVASLLEAIERFEKEQDRFLPDVAHAHALGFRKERFQEELRGFMERELQNSRIRKKRGF